MQSAIIAGSMARTRSHSLNVAASGCRSPERTGTRGAWLHRPQRLRRGMSGSPGDRHPGGYPSRLTEPRIARPQGPLVLPCPIWSAGPESPADGRCSKKTAPIPTLAGSSGTCFVSLSIFVQPLPRPRLARQLARQVAFPNVPPRDPKIDTLLLSILAHRLRSITTTFPPAKCCSTHQTGRALADIRRASKGSRGNQASPRRDRARHPTGLQKRPHAHSRRRQTRDYPSTAQPFIKRSARCPTGPTDTSPAGAGARDELGPPDS